MLKVFSSTISLIHSQIKQHEYLGCCTLNSVVECCDCYGRAVGLVLLKAHKDLQEQQRHHPRQSGGEEFVGSCGAYQ